MSEDNANAALRFCAVTFVGCFTLAMARFVFWLFFGI